MPDWNVRLVTNMDNAFSGLATFNVDLSGWNTSQVTSMNSLFKGAAAFNQDISAWDISQVTSAKSMFSGASSFNQNLSSWDASKLTIAEAMFEATSAFDSVLKDWNVSNLKTTRKMFTLSAFDQDIGAWNTSKVTDMSDMFLGASLFNRDLSRWSTSEVTSMNNMFKNAPLFAYDVSEWSETKLVTSVEMFSGAAAFLLKFSCTGGVNGPGSACTCGANYCLTDATFFEAVEACLSEAPIDGLCEEYGLSSTKYGVMPKWDVSRVTNMRGFDGLDFTGFGDKDTFNSDISRWKTSRVTNMEYMFIYASSFNQDLSVWDTSSVTSMSHMLYEAASFKYDIASWEVSSVADFGNMLYGATAFQERFVCSDANEGPPGSCVQLTLLKPPPSSPPPPLPPPPLFLTSLVADATQPKLYASDAAADDKFGMCVSLNEDTALIGSVLDDDNGVSNSGSVYIFTRSSADGTFTQQSKLYASDAAASDLFGISVSLYGNTALIGAHSDDDNGVSDSGSVYIFTRSSADGTFTQQAKLHANDAAASDKFGVSVSLYGDTALIGAIEDDDNGASASGSVYVFTRSSADGTFTPQAKLHANDAAVGDNFGISVSLYGDTALIGARLDDDNGVSDSGSVYIFTRSSADGTFTQQAKLHANDAAASDRFGVSVSLYGDTALIGARHDDDNGVSDSGSVYIFTRSSVDGTFTQQSKIYASDAAVGDSFGVSVSLDGNTALIGAYYDDNNGSNSGSVYVFKAPPPSPPPPPPLPLFLTSLVADATQPKLYASDAAADDKFGMCVSLNEDTALIGSVLDDDNGVSNSGSVYIFTRSSADGTFTQQSKLYASDAAASDLFGISVSLYGNTALIGAHSDDDNGVSDSGSVYIFTRSSADGTFTQQAKLHANDAAASDKFGVSVSLYGDTALIGAIEDDDNGASASGSVYVFTRSSADGTFTPQAKLHANDAAVGDNFGISVSLYGDTALIGARLDDDNGVSDSGSVYIFTRSSADGTFTQQAKLHANDAAASDKFGVSVSLYGDTALIGARHDDDNGVSDSGSVYIFTRSSVDGTFTQQSKIYASDAAVGDSFGVSVSLDGNTALIGAYYDDNNGSNSGSVYVFKAPPPSPPPPPPLPLFLTSLVADATQPKLYASDAAASDLFGMCVSLNEDTALIGSVLDDDNGVSNSGSVYIFTRSSADGTFTQQSKLYASDAAASDLFGHSVSLYGNTALIGAHSDDDNGVSDSGSVYVFTRSSSDGTFAQQAKLHANDAAASDLFGRSVSLYGNTALIGAHSDDDNGVSDSGSVYIFTRSSADGTFTQQAKLHANDAAVGDKFGVSVSLYGDTALIGARQDDDNGVSDSGSVYIFTRSSADGTFTQQAKLHANDAAASDKFGVSVSLYGDTALIGARQDDDNGVSDSGSVYIFTRSSVDGTFTQQSKIYASDAAVGDSFGVSVSLDGNTALIGAYYDDNNGSNSGSVYVFKAPPPSPPPPPPLPLAPIPEESWHDFVAECLDEAPVTGECTAWASGNNYGTMPNWNTSLVEDMSGYDGGFQGFGAKSTFDGDISKWNTEKVTNMGYMFHSASAFNQDIGDWNTEKVTTMRYMFERASAFNQDIGSWNYRESD